MAYGQNGYTPVHTFAEGVTVKADVVLDKNDGLFWTLHRLVFPVGSSFLWFAGVKPA